MTTYKYKGQSLSGARVSGVVRAYDEFEAVAKLRDTCAFITKIEPVKERGNALDKPIGFPAQGQGAGAALLAVFHHSHLGAERDALRGDGRLADTQ